MENMDKIGSVESLYTDQAIVVRDLFKLAI